MPNSLGDRMKEYESVWNIKIPRRLPVIIRVDGNSFSKKVKQWKLQKPYDHWLTSSMNEACKAVCQYCSGVVCAYTFSDEASFVLVNDQTIQTDPFLGNRIQKITSLVGSVFTNAFNKQMDIYLSMPNSQYKDDANATFDCRVFTLPKEEVANYLIWRQNECWRNAVSTVTYYKLTEAVGGKGQARKLMHGLNSSQQQELLFQHTGFNMNDTPEVYKRGTIITNKVVSKEPFRKKWLESPTPLFTQDREFIWENIYEETNPARKD